MAGAFVVQHHRCPQGDHYDWMLEGAEALITFHLPVRLDDLRVGQSIDVRKLADHRPAYLTYEGPVSGGRGHVHIDERGTYAATGDLDDRWVVRLSGQRISGSFSLDPLAGDEYRLTRIE